MCTDAYQVASMSAKSSFCVNEMIYLPEPEGMQEVSIDSSSALGTKEKEESWVVSWTPPIYFFQEGMQIYLSDNLLMDHKLVLAFQN